MLGVSDIALCKDELEGCEVVDVIEKKYESMPHSANGKIWLQRIYEVLITLRDVE